MIMNNISKAFNGRILEARDKPIITLLEWIRQYWMSRFAKKMLKSQAYEGIITLKPLERLERNVRIKQMDTLMG